MSSVAKVPPVRVELDGRALPERAVRSLTVVRVRQRLSLPAQCDLRFVADEEDLPPAESLVPGTELCISLGADPLPVFRGDITAVEFEYGPANERELRVRGYDPLHRLRKRQPVRSHVEVTLAELARDLVSDLGLSVEAIDTGPTWNRIAQFRQTDWEVLLEVAERCGAYFAVFDGILHILTLEGKGREVQLELGSSLLEASVEVNAERSCRGVSALAWDPHRAETRQGRVTRPRSGLDVAAMVWPDDLGGTGERTLVGLAVQDDRQTEALAQAELDCRTAQSVVLRGVADGNVDLRPGTRVEVLGIDPLVQGRYVLTEVEHIVDAHSGFITRLSTQPPAPRSRQSGTAATLGRVTAIEDPEGLGRIRVALPAYGDLETDWLGVVSPGAGEGKGLMSIPDEGDRVLVLLAGQDPAQGVVVGGLYGGAGPPEETVEEGETKRFTLVTRGGQRISLDDAGNVVRLENSEGSYVELGPERVIVHANTVLDIQAPGQAIVIRGASIDFETA